jgi:hypothetical protein
VAGSALQEQTEPTNLVLAYASQEAREYNPFLRPMRSWRRFCGYCFWLTVVGLMFRKPFALNIAVMTIFTLGMAALACVTGGLALFYMGRAARYEVSLGYAVRQLVLAGFLSVFGLFGVWLIPPLVEADLQNWRCAEERDEVSAAGEGVGART